MRYILIVFSFVYFSTVFAQGPWAPGTGHGYSQILINVIPTYSQIYDGGNTTRQSERELFDFTAAAYAEFGVTATLTVGVNLPFVHVSSGTASDPDITPVLPSGELNHLGNTSLFTKYTLWNEKLKVALIGQLDLPTSTRDQETGLSTGVDAMTLLPKLSIGGGQNEWFIYGFFGYGFRTNDYHDFINFGVEGGLKANDLLTVMVNINRWHNLNNGNPLVDTQSNIETGLYTSFQAYNAFLLKVFAEELVGPLGVFASVGGGMGTSVAASPALSLGCFYKW